MQVHALVCVRCGGPLPAIQPPAVVECEFCGVGLSVSRGLPVLAREAADTYTSVDYAKQRREFLDLLREKLDAKLPAEHALREASAAKLGAAGQTDTFARVVLAITRDFERDNKISVQRDAQVLARIAEGYLKMIAELKSVSETELSLPFLAADETGPKHLQRRITAETIQRLASGDAVTVEQPPAARELPKAIEQPAATDKQKRWWWPF